MTGEEAADDRVGDSDGISEIGLGPSKVSQALPELPSSDVPASTHERSIAERQSRVKRQSMRRLALWQDVGVATKKKLSEVGKRIRDAMERAGIETQADLARKAKIDPGVLTRLISGERTQQRAATMEKVASALGVSSGWLQTGVGVSKGPGYPSAVKEAIATYVWPKDMPLGTIRRIQAQIHAELEPESDDDIHSDLPVETIQQRITHIIEES